MKVLVIGSHGRVGRRVIQKLSDQNHRVLAMIRDKSQKADVEKAGASAVVADLEGDLSPAFDQEPDVVIFTAGSGSHTGEDKTLAVDLRGALKSIDACVKHRVSRYVMVSALGADDKDQQPENMQHYYRAKSEADQYLVQSGLDYTIFRPGRLTEESGDGNITAAERLEYNKDMNRSISRDDLATAIAYSIDKRNTHQKVIELLDGKTPIREAIDNI